MRLIVFEHYVSILGIKVDNSSLTGESEPQERSNVRTHDNPLETKNLMFNSTQVVEGKGVGVVIRVGDHTVIGHIAGLVAGSKKKTSTLRKGASCLPPGSWLCSFVELDRFVIIIACIAIFCGILFIIIGFATIPIKSSSTITKIILCMLLSSC